MSSNPVTMQAILPSDQARKAMNCAVPEYEPIMPQQNVRLQSAVEGQSSC